MLRAGRIMSGLPALFLLMDGVMKLVKPEPVILRQVRDAGRNERGDPRYHGH
jgi:hypothetical protein